MLLTQWKELSTVAAVVSYHYGQDAGFEPQSSAVEIVLYIIVYLLPARKPRLL